MRLAALCAALVAWAALLGPGTASAQFGLKDLDATFTDAGGGTAVAAGTHPFAFTTEFAVNTTESAGIVVPDGSPRELTISLPPGLAGNPTATVRCTTLEFLRMVDTSSSVGEGCPFSSQVGTTDVTYGDIGTTESFSFYNLTPPPGAAAKFGFVVANVPVTLEATVNPRPPYNILVSLANIPQAVPFYASKTTVWGFPADPAHDSERAGCAPGCSASLLQRPFLTLPRACRGPLEIGFATRSWEDPATEVAPPPLLTHDDSEPPRPRGFGECERLGFGPEIDARPTSRAATSPSGLDFSLEVKDEGLTDPTGTAASDIEKTVVTLPRGMTINPSQAEGLEVCSEAQLARESAFSAPGAGCPQASKIGTVEVETPLLEDQVLKGTLFVAEPYRNPFGTLIALYMVIKDPGLGILVELPLKVEPDPATGQLVSTAEDLPQLPFSHFRLHFREGGRAPLISPPGCGTFETKAVLYPYSGAPPVTSTSAFQIISGPSGGACPAGAAPFEPGFEAGTLNNAAGRYSPFEMRITRADGEQDLTKLSQVLPPGVVGKIAGLARCSDAAIARAASRTGAEGGREERDDPSCPAGSLIGATEAGAGVGSQLTYVSGRLYLAGPYHGDPLSVVSITPALAGPFDAGTVVVRFALTLNPLSGEVEIDGSASDPIPHILKGIPLNVRDLRAHVDKPDLTLNATSCEVEQTRARIWGGGTALAPLADHPVDLRARYQAAGCASLGFKPRLRLKLRGATRRGRFPALNALYTPRAADANLDRLALAFPRSEFIEQGHFRTICTRVQFAAGPGNGARCPKGSVYGHVKVWTPLLEEPLTGPVYLRSSNHNLPDAIFALRSPIGIRIEIAVRIDSVHGRLRTIVAGVPDAPVSRALVRMQGGQKGLFVNSRNLCFKPARNRARVNLRGQNGKLEQIKPLVRALGCRKAHRKRHSAHRSR